MDILDAGRESACQQEPHAAPASHRNTGTHVIRRRLASLTPLLATLCLTCAVFLLPATSDRRPARAFDGDIQVSATHIEFKGVDTPGH